jgi:uncharacterized protein (DUF924 family)
MAAAWCELLDFWFSSAADDGEVARQQSALWWSGDEDSDALIRVRFGNLRASAVRGELDHWLEEPHGRLALIVLADQFSRNLFRGSPEAFAADPLARRWCLHGLDLGVAQRLRPIERVFLYLPLEHSEQREDQQRAVALFEALCAEVPDAQRGIFEGFADYARRHRDVVERFGRFPHRNAVLGRASTAEELDFLQQPGAAF